MTPDEQQQQESYTFAIAVGTLALADGLACEESDRDRKTKMDAVVKRKASSLREAFGERAHNVVRGAYGRILDGCVPAELRVRFLIDLAFSNPFAPYELKFSDKLLKNGVKWLGGELGINAAKVDRIFESRADAFKAHRRINGMKIALLGVGGAALLAVGGWVAAPLIGSAIGTAAGLSGAAATAHGLAILGGGSLALGGAGMAGGLWVVVGAGAALGGLGAGGANALLQLGAAAARVELIKLQVSFREVLLANQAEAAKAQSVLKNLAAQREEIERQLAEERELNDKNSRRLAQMQETLDAITISMKWMGEQAA